MKGALVLFRREMTGYLQSPIAAIVVIAFLLLSGGIFTSQFFISKLLDMRTFFSILPLILSVVLPAVSMRLWAEDRQMNTMELLLSMPLSPAALVAGKFLAALAFYALMLASTWTVPLMLAMLGRPDPGPILTGYLGAFLLGALFLGIGQFISGFCRDQIVAFILAFFASLGLYLAGLDWIAAVVDGWWPGLGGFLQQYIGIARHVAGFEKGVIDNRDVAYFLLLTAVFLILNGIWIEGRLRPKAKVAFITACVLGVGIGLTAQVVFQYLPVGRFDWTAGKSYTVSTSTREILKSLEVPAVVKLYLSPPEKMPTAMRTLERDLRDALEELKLVSGGKLKYQVFHMEAIVTPEEEAKETQEGSLREKLGKKGIRPFQVQSIEADEVGVKLVYASAAIAYKDQPEEIIPQLVPGILSQLEYTLISKIYRMTLEEQPLVTIVLPESHRNMDSAAATLMRLAGQGENPYQYLSEVLEFEGYRTAQINLTKDQPIPEKSRVLVLIGTGILDDRQRYEINRYLVQGGSVFLAAQPYRYQYVRQPAGIVPTPQKEAIGVQPLLEKWGAAVSDKILLDERARILSASTGARLGPFAISIPIQSALHIDVAQDQINQELGMTNQLLPIFYLWGSPLEINKERLQENKLTHTILFTSSKKSWAIPRSEYDTFTPAAAAKRETPGKFPLGVFITGVFPDVYAGQPVPDWASDAATQPAEGEKKEKQEKPVSSLTGAPGQLILTGCDEMFKEHLAESGGQLVFFMNAMDTLISGGKLVNIRSKQQTLRTFPPPSETKKMWLRFIALGFMPAVVIILSIGSAAWRKRLREIPAGV
ncbi:MAG: Gldg family protein [Candidatus Omnitrophica bacterium]|nr:Gldg family protein [Candidatus Omnitrophota bacterium]